MDLIVKRTSIYSDEIPPCEEAKRKPFPCFHVRTITEEEFDRKFSHSEGLWRSKGFNHSVTEEGYIKRQESDIERWYVEINSLDDIFKFYYKYGDLIIGSDYLAHSTSIEIYDDYRE